MNAIVFTDEDVAAIERLVANARQALVAGRALDPDEDRRWPVRPTDTMSILQESVRVLTTLLRRAGR